MDNGFFYRIEYFCKGTYHYCNDQFASERNAMDWITIDRLHNPDHTGYRIIKVTISEKEIMFMEFDND